MPFLDISTFKSLKMKRFYARLEPFINSDVNMMLRGESGTGKSELAKWIHRVSVRQSYPYTVFSPKRFDSQNLADVLFGIDARASLNGEASQGLLEITDGGTLIIDDIDHMNTDVGKLLHVASTPANTQWAFTRVGGRQLINVNVRIICVGSEPLRAGSVASGSQLDSRLEASHEAARFFDRICEQKLIIPGLVHRIEDIPALACAFAEDYYHSQSGSVARSRPQASNRVKSTQFSRDALDRLKDGIYVENLTTLKKSVFLTLGRAAQTKGPQLIGGSDICFPKPLQHQRAELEHVMLGFLDKIPDKLLPALLFKRDITQSLENKKEGARQVDLASAMGISAKTFRKRHNLVKELNQYLEKQGW